MRRNLLYGGVAVAAVVGMVLAVVPALAPGFRVWVVVVVIGILLVALRDRRRGGRARAVQQRDGEKAARRINAVVRQLRRLDDELAGLPKRLERDLRADRAELIGLRSDLERLEQHTVAGLGEVDSRTRRIEVISTASADVVEHLVTSHAVRTRQLEEAVNLGVRTAKSHFSRQQAQRAEPIAQIQALIELNLRLRPGAPMPANVGSWAADPTTISRLVHLVLTNRPAVVVECGSGLSSLWLGYAVKEAGVGRVVSLEHEPSWLEQSRRRVAEHGLGNHVEIRSAPLGTVGTPWGEQSWYDRGALEDLHDIGLLFVDGPPESTGDRSRWPAYPLLRDRLAPVAHVVMDDTIRASERDGVQTWLEDPCLELVEEVAGRATILGFQAERSSTPG